jgi:hypothetical protein
MGQMIDRQFYRCKKAIQTPSGFPFNRFILITILLLPSLTGPSLFPGSAGGSQVLSDGSHEAAGRMRLDRLAESHPSKKDDSAVRREVRKIRVESAPGGEEKVLLWIDGFRPPRHFALEGDRPRIVCDFYDTRLGKDADRRIQLKGRLIRQLRTGFYGGKRPKLRIVLDLVPEKNYEVDQIYYRKNKLYTITVKEKQAYR